MSVALRADDVTVRFGGLVANDHVSLAVEAGQIVGLIGPNGAGKSTFVDAVTGFVASTGSVLLGDRPIGGLPPHRRARLGLARTWQSLELFDDLSVRGNLEVAFRIVTAATFLRDAVVPRPPQAAPVDAVLDVLGLRAIADLAPPALSLGDRKLLGVARALAASPSVVLLDEPASGLDLGERRTFGEHLRRLAATGLGLLLIEHDVDLVLAVCDRVVVLDFGRVIAAGTPATVRSDPRVAAAYLGDPTMQAVGT